VKCKNANYALCRLLRERVCGFVRELIKLEQVLNPAHTSKQIKPVLR
jgi:hypothetical protein